MNIDLIVKIIDRWFNSNMSAEKIISTDANEIIHLTSSQKSKATSPARVDINTLLNRARKAKEKETRSNLIFLGLICSLIAVVGLILSF